MIWKRDTFVSLLIFETSSDCQPDEHPLLQVFHCLAEYTIIHKLVEIMKEFSELASRRCSVLKLMYGAIHGD
jgi:hypothetical protein